MSAAQAGNENVANRSNVWWAPGVKFCSYEGDPYIEQYLTQFKYTAGLLAPKLLSVPQTECLSQSGTELRVERACSSRVQEINLKYSPDFLVQCGGQV